MTEAAETEGKAKRVPAGSLLLSFKLTVGKVGFAATDLYPNEAIAWLRPRDCVSKEFLALALESLPWDEYGSHAVKGKTLNSAALDALPISYPSADAQRRIVDLISAVDEVLEAAGDSAQTGYGDAVRRLRKDLLDVLLTGQHAIPIAYDLCVGLVD